MKRRVCAVQTRRLLTANNSPFPPAQASLGIQDVHSGSSALSLEGTPYNSWKQAGVRSQKSEVARTAAFAVRGSS
jgi:hypothetical protein